MRYFRIGGRWAAQAATALLAGGLSVRLTIGDSIPGIAAIYYATPWAVLASMGVFPTVLWARRRRWLPMLGFFLVSAACAFAWIRTSFHSAPKGAGATFRVAYWNVGRPTSNLGEVLDTIVEVKADVFGLGETNRHGGEPIPRPEWSQRQPDKHVLALRRHMLLVSKTAATQLHDGFLNDRGQYALTETELAGRKVFVLMADFDAIVSWSRKPAFDRLIEIIDAIGDEPLIVLGDFNTPSDSAFFLPLRKRLRDVFEAAGHGYAHTWPMPLPVLDLDHIWVSHHFRVVESEHLTNFLSDHRAVVAGLAFQ